MATAAQEKQAFLEAILANPGDDNVRLVFADWCEERATGPEDSQLHTLATVLRRPGRDILRAVGLGTHAGQRQLIQVVDRTPGCFLGLVPLSTCQAPGCHRRACLNQGDAWLCDHCAGVDPHKRPRCQAPGCRRYATQWRGDDWLCDRCAFGRDAAADA